MKTNNATILDTFGMTAEDFYYLCIEGKLSPIANLTIEIDKLNKNLPERLIDDNQRERMIGELEETIDELNYSMFKVLQLRSVPDRDNDENLNIVDSTEIAEFGNIKAAANHFNKCEISHTPEGDYIGYEIVRIDEDDEILGTAGNFIKGVVISEF